MGEYRYRLLLTIRGKPVGVALETPQKELIIKLGDDIMEFEENAPTLEMMHHYVEKMAEKAEYKHLELDYCGRVMKIPADKFVSIDHVMKYGEAY